MIHLLWHFFICALIFGCVFQFNLLFPNQFLSSVTEPTIAWVKNLREMNKAEKLSPSSIYLKGASKRTKMIVEAIRQHARENPAMKKDGTIETDRERGLRLMKNGRWSATHDRTWSEKPIRMHQRQPWVSLDRRSCKIRKLAEFIRTSLSETMTHELNQPLRNMALRNHLQVDHRHMLKEEGRERIYYRSNWNSKPSRNQWTSKCPMILWSTMTNWMWTQLFIQRILDHDI